MASAAHTCVRAAKPSASARHAGSFGFGRFERRVNRRVVASPLDEMHQRTFEHVVSLAERRTRAQGIAALAAEVGAQALFAFMPDPQRTTLVPAPGFEEAPSDVGWCELLQHCRAPGLYTAQVDLPSAEQLT